MPVNARKKRSYQWIQNSYRMPPAGLEPAECQERQPDHIIVARTSWLPGEAAWLPGEAAWLPGEAAWPYHSDCQERQPDCQERQPDDIIVALVSVDGEHARSQVNKKMFLKIRRSPETWEHAFTKQMQPPNYLWLMEWFSNYSVIVALGVHGFVCSDRPVTAWSTNRQINQCSNQKHLW